MNTNKYVKRCEVAIKNYKEKIIRRGVKWWDEELENMKRKIKQERKRLQQNRDNTDQVERKKKYYENRRKYRNKIEEKKTQIFRKM